RGAAGGGALRREPRHRPAARLHGPHAHRAGGARPRPGRRGRPRGCAGGAGAAGRPAARGHPVRSVWLDQAAPARGGRAADGGRGGARRARARRLVRAGDTRPHPRVPGDDGPPVSPRGRVDFAHRIDFEDPAVWRALAWSLPLSALIGWLALRWAVGTGTRWALLVAVLAFAVTLVASAAGALALAYGSARGATAFLLPGGAGTPSVRDFSYEKTLLARGRLAGGVAARGPALAARPDDAALCLFLADVHAREAGDPARAERLFLRAR